MDRVSRLWIKYGQMGTPDVCVLAQAIKRRMATARQAGSVPGMSKDAIRCALSELRRDLSDLNASKRCRR